MIYYIIRKRGTECVCLPATQTGHKASWVEFTPLAPPRLFSDKRAAAVALTYWLRGRYALVPHLGWRNVRDTSRNRRQYEIVPVELSFPSREPDLFSSHVQLLNMGPQPNNV